MTSLDEREDARRREELARCFPPGDPRRDPGYWREKVEDVCRAGFAEAGRRAYRLPEHGDPLTEHEQRVRDLMVAGQRPEDIAFRLRASTRTIRTTIQRIERKGAAHA